MAKKNQETPPAGGVVAEPEQVPPQPPEDVTQGTPKDIPVPVPTPGPEAGPKKGPGRPKGSGNKAPSKPASSTGVAEVEAVITALLVMLFDLLAARLGEEWKIDPGAGGDYPEAKAVAGPAARIVDRLGGRAIGKYGDWIALAGGLTMLLAPRALVYAQKQARAAKDKPQAPSTPAPGPKSQPQEETGGVMESVSGILGGVVHD